jgi:hypothetical protein
MNKGAPEALKLAVCITNWPIVIGAKLRSLTRGARQSRINSSTECRIEPITPALAHKGYDGHNASLGSFDKLESLNNSVHIAIH